MKPLIIIIDQYVRRKNRLASLFIEIGCRIFSFSKDNTLEEWDIKVGDWSPIYDQNPDCLDLMLIHGGDNAFKDSIPFKKRIWFSGITGRDSRAEPNEDFIFMPLDDRGDKMLPPDDAKELVQYAMGSVNRPKCLRSEYFNPKLEVVLDLLHTLGCSRSIDDDKKLETQIAAIELHIGDSAARYLRAKLVIGQTPDIRTLRHIRDELFKTVTNA